MRESGLAAPKLSWPAPQGLSQLERLGLIKHVDGIDEARSFGLAGDDQRLGPSAAVEEAHAVHQGAGGDTASGKQDRFTRSELISVVNAIGIFDAHFLQTSQVAFLALADQAGLDDFGIVNQLALEVTAQAAHCGGGDDALGSSTDAHQRVDVGAGEGAGDSSGHVTVGDQAHPSTRFADFP